MQPINILQTQFKKNVNALNNGEFIEELPLVDPAVSLDEVEQFIGHMTNDGHRDSVQNGITYVSYHFNIC